MKLVFLLNYTLRFFMFKFDLNVKHLTFSNKSHGLQKKLFTEKKCFFSVDSVKTIELHVVHT